MLQYIITTCVFFWCIHLTLEQGEPKFNLSISSLHNHAGRWYAKKIQLDHEGENPWNVYVNYTGDNSKCSQTIFMTDKKEDKKFLAPGFELLKDLGYYKIHPESKSWHEALKICEQEGAHLLIVDSKQEIEQVDSLIANSSKGRTVYWIGVHDQFKEGDYVTIFSETFKRTPYFTWRPNEYEHEDCGCLNYSGSVYGFCDYGCNKTVPFICEQEFEP